MNKYGSQSYRKHFGVIKKEKNIKIKQTIKMKTYGSQP